MIIQKRTLNWLPKPTLYQEQAHNRAKQRNTHRNAADNMSNLSSSIADIQTNFTAETTNLVSKVALQRMGYSKKV